MKRFWIISILLIVNMLILTQAFVPHHHHENIPCFTQDIEQTCCDDIRHQTSAEQEHQNCTHHTHRADGSCMIEDFVIIHENSQKGKIHCPVCLHDHTHHLLQAVLFILNYDFLIPENENHLQPSPYLISYYSVFVSRSLGLRAPPIS